MPTAAIWAYLERLPGLQAEARWQAIEAAMAPHVKDRDRRAMFRRLERMMQEIQEPGGRMKPSRAQLALIGIGYRGNQRS